MNYLILVGSLENIDKVVISDTGVLYNVIYYTAALRQCCIT